MRDGGSGLVLDRVTRELIRLALEEDLAGYGDVTSTWAVAEEVEARAHVVARSDLVVSGLPVAAAVLAEVDPDARFTGLVREGARATRGTPIAELQGAARSLLSAERTLLNFLVRLCAVATHTRRFSDAIMCSGASIVDTRKTTPGLRSWEKRAVRDGGGRNHRYGLFDLVLIKDNHILAAGGIEPAVEKARAQAPAGMKIEVEVEDEVALREAVEAGADIVMLDNQDNEQLARLVSLARELRPEVVLEASGGITLERVARVAWMGVNLISIGALTASPPPVDLALDFLAESEEVPESRAESEAG